MDWTLLLAGLGVLATVVAPVLTTFLEANRRDRRWSVIMECSRLLDDPAASASSRAVALDRLAEIGLTEEDLRQHPMRKAREQAEALFASPAPQTNEDPETQLMRRFFRRLSQIEARFDEVNQDAFIRRQRFWIYIYFFGVLCAALTTLMITRALS